MKKDQIDYEQKKLNESLEKYKTAQTEEEKLDHLEGVAFQHMVLGNYDEAIEYYEKVLELNKYHYPALTNIAYMYEEMGEIETALKYEQRLFAFNKDDFQVVEDLVRLLVADDQIDEAKKVVTEYFQTDKGKQNPGFVDEQLDYILNATEKKK